jgi:PDDEXK-like domain of unknown function (DUF3799)
MTLLHDMSNEDYRKSEGLSHSESKVLRQRSPHHMHMQREHRGEAPPRKPSPQMLLGTAVHCAVLEPTTFDQRYCDDLDENKNSKAYKEFAQSCANAGLLPISSEDRERVFAMRASLLADPQIADSLSVGRAEVSAWWKDPATGVLCKCRPDFVRPTGNGASALLVDLKTTADASPDQFSRSIATFGYHTQADHYTRGYALASGLAIDGMLFVAVETEFPYACAAYTLTEAALELAARMNAKVLATYAQCVSSGIWPSYGTGVQDIDIPPWAYKQAEYT